MAYFLHDIFTSFLPFLNRIQWKFFFFFLAPAKPEKKEEGNYFSDSSEYLQYTSFLLNLTAN